MDMIETSTSGFKAKLGQFMKAVRSGREVVITDRDRPVARLVPFEKSVERREPLISTPRDPSAPRLKDLKFKRIDYRGRSSTALLRSDRDKR